MHARGTAAHADWCASRLRACAEILGVPPDKVRREEWLAFERSTGDRPYVCKRDITSAGNLGAIRKLAMSGTVEGLEWDEDEDTQPGEVPLPAIPDRHFVKGVSTFVGPDGEIKGQWVKTSREQETRAALLEQLTREIPGMAGEPAAATPMPTATLSADLLAVYPMGDPHVGMLSWEPETGASFDLKRAEGILCSAFDELTQRGPAAEQALVVNLGDFFHSDDESATTRRSGHPLDVDGRYFKVARVGLRIMIYAVARALEHHARVRVVNEIGNHDDISAMWLSIALDAHFSNEPRVEVDLSPSRFHWHTFGANLIGITHGHNQKHGDLGAIMAAEKAAEWGATQHRYWYVGHIHHSTKKELRGCVVESFRTLAPRDAWAANAGYRAGRDLNRITLHRGWGEIGREIVSASYLESQYRGAA